MRNLFAVVFPDFRFCAAISGEDLSIVRWTRTGRIESMHGVNVPEFLRRPLMIVDEEVSHLRDHVRILCLV
jgi:hypothetical protein